MNKLTSLRTSRGMTLLEAMITVSMLGVLMTAVLAVYLMGMRAWAQGDAQAELLADLDVLSTRLSRSLEQSVYEGVSVGDGGHAVALLVPTDSQGNYSVDPELGTARWERYEVFYLDGRTVRRRQIDLRAGAPERENPGPIDSYNPGGGAVPLEDYLDEGLPVARNVVEFTVEQVPLSRLVRVVARVEKVRYGRKDPESMALDILVRLRNTP